MAIREDTQEFAGGIVERCSRTSEAAQPSLQIYEFKANVLCEVGFAHALGKPTDQEENSRLATCEKVALYVIFAEIHDAAVEDALPIFTSGINAESTPYFLQPS